jgi:hypothetical protein
MVIDRVLHRNNMIDVMVEIPFCQYFISQERGVRTVFSPIQASIA